LKEAKNYEAISLGYSGVAICSRIFRRRQVAEYRDENSRGRAQRVAMSQTSVIFAALLVGFIVYVTSKGQLPQYLAVMGFGNTSSSSNTTSNTATTTAPSLSSDLQNYGNGAGTSSSTNSGLSAAAPALLSAFGI
jgi:hypothetical protein